MPGGRSPRPTTPVRGSYAVRTPAWLGERHGGRVAAADDEQVGLDRLLGAAAGRGEGHGGQPGPPVRTEHRRRGEHRDRGGAQRGAARARLGACVRDRRDGDAGALQRQGRLQAAFADRGHDGPRPRRQPVAREQAAGAAGEHDPGAIVVGEQERLLDRAGRVDVLARPDLVQGVALPDRAQPVVVAEHGGAREQLDPGRGGPPRELGRELVAPLVEQAPAEAHVLVGEHDVGAELGGGDRRAQPGGAAADDEHVGVAAAILGRPGALGLRARAGVRARRRGAGPSRRAATGAAAAETSCSRSRPAARARAAGRRPP